MTDVMKLLEESGAFLKGHFKLSSGRHSNGYVQCAKLIMHPEKCQEVARVIADKIDFDLDLVVGPAMGGIIIAYELARQLGKPAIFSEREDDLMTFRRGFEIGEGEKIIICEDVVTTGKSSMETRKAIEDRGGKVLGLACICNRSGKDEIEGLKIYSAIDLDIRTYDKDDCPLCKEGLDLVKPGSRKKFD